MACCCYTNSGRSVRLAGLGPPMEVGVRLESGGIEPAAALGDDGGELVQRGDMPIGDRLIHQRPETFGGLELRPVGRQEDEADPVRDGQVFGAMPARVVEHEDDAAPTARAGLAREGGERFGEEGLGEAAAEIPDRPSPLVGCTKATTCSHW